MAKKGTFTAYQQLTPLKADLSKPSKDQEQYLLQKEKAKPKPEEVKQEKYKGITLQQGDFQAEATGFTSQDDLSITLANKGIDKFNELSIEAERLFNIGDKEGSDKVKQRALKLRNVFKNHANATSTAQGFYDKFTKDLEAGKVSSLDTDLVKNVNSFLNAKNLDADVTDDGDIIYSVDAVDEMGEAILDKDGNPKRTQITYGDIMQGKLQYTPNVELYGDGGLINKAISSLKTHTSKQVSGDGNYSISTIKWSDQLEGNTKTFFKGLTDPQLADLYKDLVVEESEQRRDFSDVQKEDVVRELTNLVKGAYDTSHEVSKAAGGDGNDKIEKGRALKFNIEQFLKTGIQKDSLDTMSLLMKTQKKWGKSLG